MNDDEYTTNVSVPKWMMSLLVWIVIVLSSGAVSSISITIHWVFRLSERIAATEVTVGRHADELDDHKNAFAEIKRDLASIKESLAAIRGTK